MGLEHDPGQCDYCRGSVRSDWAGNDGTHQPAAKGDGQNDGFQNGRLDIPLGMTAPGEREAGIELPRATLDGLFEDDTKLD